MEGIRLNSTFPRISGSPLVNVKKRLLDFRDILSDHTTLSPIGSHILKTKHFACHDARNVQFHSIHMQINI